MTGRQLLLGVLTCLTAGSITLYLSNKIGKTVENYEAGIYQKISGKKPQYVKYDKSGLPTVVYEGNAGEHETVVMTAQAAFKYYENIEDQVSRSKFFTCIDWLKANNSNLNDSSIIYYVDFDWPSYKMKKPWRSAMSQGRAMQAFLKAFELTKDSTYLDYAKRSMNTLYADVVDGGVTYKDTNGFWYEEYADDSVPQSRVLNGMIVVLQALWDFHKITNDESSLFLFTKGEKAVKHTLHLYDNEGHSNYDVLGKPAKPWYHNFHIELMDFLFTTTHDPIYNEYKQKWMQYREPSYLTALVQKPTRIGVFAVFTLFVTVYAIAIGISFILIKYNKLKKLKEFKS
jgi:hypothetical protein